MGKITFGAKYNKRIENTPGPGYYDAHEALNKTQCSTVAVSMRGKSRELKIDTNLGPGEYDAHLDKIGSNAQKWTMAGKDHRTKLNLTPSVGQYEVAKSIQYTKPRS